MQDPYSPWSESNCTNWHAALDSYGQVIASQEVSDLEALDCWYREDLPALLEERGSPPFITLTELAKVTRWKMKRGVWRQRNLLLVEGNPDNTVRERSQEAFAAVPDPRKPISLLSTLAGVGPATASAVMAALTPAIYPFFDELVAVQMPELGAVTFTAAYYARYADMLRERTGLLNRDCAHFTWTVQMVSQALWAASEGKIRLIRKIP